MSRLLFIICCFVSCFISVNSQELPPIKSYHQDVYQGGNQNWMISQDAENNIFVANNEGLLKFDGSRWYLYPTPNETIMRSVYCDENRVYTGAYMDFGYWIKNEFGKYVYTSLSGKLKISLIEDEQFWGIIPHDDYILFQSLQRIYIYNSKTDTIQIVDPKSAIFKVYQTDNFIFFQCDSGLYEIINGKPVSFLSNNQILNNKIIAIFESKDKELTLVTQNQGILKYNNQILSKLSTDVDKIITNDIVYSSIQLKNGNIIMGTISSGVIKITPNGEKKFHITQKNGINNNTVLSLFEDLDSNLWLGLDNGIDCINLTSPIKSYSNKTGLLGTVYTSIVFNNKLYIGTNQGLFVKSFVEDGDFELVTGTKGQVWSLFKHDNQLFCGHDSGTFLINDNQSQLIYSQQGTWKFEVYKDEIVQGNYYGLSVLRKVNNQWKFDRKIKNFSISSRFFEFTTRGEMIVSHEYKGLMRLIFDQSFTKVDKFVKINEPQKSKHSGLVKFNGSILYASRNGVYNYIETKNTFEKSAFLSAIFENNEYVSGRMIVDRKNTLWFFTKSYLHYFTASKITNELKKNSISIPASLTNSMPGFENITQIGETEHLFGTTDGYYTLKTELKINRPLKISISEITSLDKVGTEYSTPINEAGKFNHNQNNLSFSFSVPAFDKYLNPEYQYTLEGFHEQWSKWTSNSNISFENLPPGKYTFKVKATVANTFSENIATYTFEILKPWYYSKWAVGCYILCMLIFGYLINKVYNDYHNKKHQRIIAENNILLEIKELESQKEIMKIKNEQLTQDVDKKNKELAVSTMNLLKKDELLKIIKEDLKQSTELSTSKKIKSVISSINSSVNEENTWNMFKEAFDKADNDFIKKIKNAHPSLTPNDLRLCAYLRLNLSSKEIAPLLNISVRSVEIKRYRLRKKMDLPHEQSLVDYILSI